ncbi:response regulator [Leptospira semungkisensis]|uniref:histidine kinase n=1 Tax=Leptospira semungkisensis TaxID=2484985 RepID=A0A4R9FS34_9LEPT|nr:PAS domain S-box protein [Leptospira semungkisensis]TGK00687.1 response regulator [Leptospira semungkisensis]
MIQTVAEIFKQNFLPQAERKKTILLVEDEAIIAFSETQRLEKNGYKVIPAYSADEAIRFATNDYTIDLILMDIDLREEEDGADAALKILKLRDIPIVFLSSHTEPEVVAKTEKITSYGYVVKNSGETVLLASIKMAFKLYESHLRLKRSEESLKENQELLEATLRSIGDGVISTDELGNITDMNYVAEVLTGWRVEDAIREPIEKVFRIVNARTRRRIRNPIDHVIPKGKIMGLENEVLLVSKNGLEYRISETSAPIRSERGYIIGSVLVFRDITKEYDLLENLKESESRFRNLANVAPVMIWIAGTDKKFSWFNQTWLDFTGKTMEDELGFGWADGIHPDDIVNCYNTYSTHFEERKSFSMSYRLRNKQGEWRWIQDNGIPITDASGIFKGYIGSSVDITEAKIAMESLSKDLEEREYLFQELQHRAKNSLNMISSIIEIEADSSSDESVKNSLANIVNRIQSVGNLYDILYTSNGSHIVRLDKYIHRITRTLLEAFHKDENRISLQQDLEPLEMDAKTAIPFGLVVNELLTNTLKYAFPGNREGTVRILLKKEGTVVNLEVSDNGVPFPKDFDMESSEGLGLKLVKLLVTQMKGNLDWKFSGEKKAQIRLCTGK